MRYLYLAVFTEESFVTLAFILVNDPKGIRNGAIEGINLRVWYLKVYRPLSSPAFIIIYLILLRAEHPFKYCKLDC